MRSRFITMVSSLSICFLFIAICFADNPIIQTKFTADPAPMVYDDTVYLYTGHDEDDVVSFFKMLNWVCYTTTDMENWTDHGVVAPISFQMGKYACAGHRSVSTEMVSFIFILAVSRTIGGMAIGVAVSNSPYGPFTDPLGHDYYAGNGDIDPTAFIDDDGQAYLILGKPQMLLCEIK